MHYDGCMVPDRVATQAREQKQRPFTSSARDSATNVPHDSHLTIWAVRPGLDRVTVRLRKNLIAT